MKVTIDTKEDSYEDIHKVLHILTSLIEKKGSSVKLNPVETNENVAAGFMDLFGDSSSASKREVPDTPPDFSSFISLTGKKDEDKKEVKPRIQFF